MIPEAIPALLPATIPGDWILAIEGTPAGARAAMALALFSALAHAILGALQKGRHDPWTSRGAIDLWAALIALPAALFLVPRPDPFLWLVLAGAWAIQTVYKVLMAMAYSRGHYTLVYPIVRGTGPLATVIFAGFVFGETFTGEQWFGVLLLSGGIFGLAVVNIRDAGVGRARLQAAVFLAVLTGLSVAVYTTYDAYGIRLAPDPFTFLAWFFVIDGVTMPVVAVLRHRRLAAAGRTPDLHGAGPLALRGLAGALAGLGSFGAVMLATRLDKVAEAASLRETSVVFAALIGWFFLGERIGRARALLMIVIALGAVRIEFG
ncbi:MAG: EamA family transporter [Proteobacteria bacterium]|nr:EamA family transporter [Pseudomonadota bacterium]